MLSPSRPAELNQVGFGDWVLPLLSPLHIHANGDTGTNLDLFLEKMLEVKELDHHISLSSPGKRREENHSSVPPLTASPVVAAEHQLLLTL